MLLSMRARGAAHFGETNPTGILAERSQLSFWPNEAKWGVRRVWSEQSTNLRLWETIDGSVPLFPDCYLQ
jgi:hypothetical protein